MYEDKEKFMTSAYKEKLKANRLWEMQACSSIISCPFVDLFGFLMLRTRETI